MKPSGIGNPNYIVRTTRDPAHPFDPLKHFGYTFQYNGQGELWFITQQRWEGATCSDPEIVSCREFRANGRNMRMTTKRDPQFLDVIEPESRVWHDFDGEDIYSDLGVAFDEVGNNMTVTELASQEPGVGAYDIATSQPSYHHGDQIGSTRIVTTQPSEDKTRVVYTAFGERVWSDGTIGTRYQYAGKYGYQTMPEYASGFSNGFGGEPGDAVPFVHVGHRWYDPTSGRFLQRDPIGIWGGANEYAYILNQPTHGVDANGFQGMSSNTATPEAMVESIDIELKTCGQAVVKSGGRRVIIEDCIHAPAKTPGIRETVTWVGRFEDGAPFTKTIDLPLPSAPPPPPPPSSSWGVNPIWPSCLLLVLVVALLKRNLFAI